MWTSIFGKKYDNEYHSRSPCGTLNWHTAFIYVVLLQKRNNVTVSEKAFHRDEVVEC